jgi:hypothetical protein
MPAARACEVTLRDLDGMTRSVTVTASTLFEAAASPSALAIVRREVLRPRVLRGDLAIAEKTK